MRTKLADNIFDDDTTPAQSRVMQAYWLAPRATRGATVTALQDIACAAAAEGGPAPNRFTPPG